MACLSGSSLSHTSKDVAAVVPVRHEVPVTGYEYQPEDDDNTFVDHGASLASASGGSGGTEKPKGTDPPTKAWVARASEEGRPYSLEAYYENLAAASAGLGANHHSTSGNANGLSRPRTQAGSGAAGLSSSASTAATATAKGVGVGGVSYRNSSSTTLPPSWQAPPNGARRTPGVAVASPLGAAAGSLAAGGVGAVWQPSQLVSEFLIGKNRVRDMALSPDGSRLFAAFSDDPVTEMELSGTTLKHARSLHGVEQVHCMAVVRLPGVNQTTFTSIDGSHPSSMSGVGSQRVRKPTRRKKKKSTRRNSASMERDFSSDDDDDDDDGGGFEDDNANDAEGSPSSRGFLSGGGEAGDETYMLWCGVNRGNIEIVDLQSSSRVGTIFNAHKQTVNKIWFLGNGRVWSAGRDKGLVVWDPLTRRSIKKRSIAAILSDLCYVSRTRQVWAIADDSFIRLYDAGGENASLPRHPHSKTRNTIPMKNDMTLVKYNEDVNLVWAGTVKSTSLIDPDTLKVLQTLRLTLSSLAFHEKTAIITGHGAWLEWDSDCVAVLDITSPLEPSLLFSGAQLDNVIPKLGMCLFKSVPLGVVAYLDGSRMQDCTLGVFVYEDTQPFTQTGAMMSARNPPVSRQRIEFLGRRTSVRSTPALTHLSPQQPQLPANGNGGNGGNLQQNPNVADVGPNSTSGTTSPTPSQQPPNSSPRAVTLVAPSSGPLPRQGTTLVSQPSMMSMESANAVSSGSAALPSRLLAAGAVPKPSVGAQGPGGPTASTANLVACSSSGGGGLATHATAATAATPPSDIQASLTQLGNKVEGLRVALFNEARAKAPQTDFGKLCLELSRWITTDRGNAVQLAESEVARISKDYATPEGKAAATAVAKLFLIAEEGGATTPQPLGAAGGGESGRSLAQSQGGVDKLGEVGDSGDAAQPSDRLSASPDACAVADARPSARRSTVKSCVCTPQSAPAFTPRTAWGQTTASVSCGAESEGVAGTNAEAVLLSIVQSEQQQREAMQRQNHRIQTKSEALANGFGLAAHAVTTLSDQVAMTAAECARVMLREGAQRGEIAVLEEKLAKLRTSLEAMTTSRRKLAVSTMPLTKEVFHTTDALVECADDARNVVSAFNTVLAYMQSPSPLGVTMGCVDNPRGSSACSDGYVVELGGTGTGQRQPPRSDTGLYGGSRSNSIGQRFRATGRVDPSEHTAQLGGALDGGRPLFPSAEDPEDDEEEDLGEAKKEVAAAMAAAVNPTDATSAALPSSSSSFLSVKPAAEAAPEEGTAPPAGKDASKEKALSPTPHGGAAVSAAPAPAPGGRGKTIPCPPSSSLRHLAKPALTSFLSAGGRYTVTVTSPRSLLDLLKGSVGTVEAFVNEGVGDWDNKLSMYRLFVLPPYNAGGGDAKAPSLTNDFIQCLAVWDSWMAVRMRQACLEELSLALVEVLLECRRNEGGCVRATDGEFDTDVSNTFSNSSMLAFPGATVVGDIVNSGSAGPLASPYPHLLYPSSLGSSVYVGASGAGGAFDAAGSSLSSSHINANSTNTKGGANADENDRGFYFISGEELTNASKGVSDRVVTASLHVERLVSHMRVSLSQLLSSIPDGVRRNRSAMGFASVIRRWEDAREEAAESAKASGSGTSHAAEVDRAPVKVFADKLRGVLYWSHMSMALIAMSLAAIISLLYRFEEGGDGGESGGRISNENYLFIHERITDWAFLLREEEAMGTGFSAILSHFERLWRSNILFLTGNGGNNGGGVEGPSGSGTASEGTTLAAATTTTTITNNTPNNSIGPHSHHAVSSISYEQGRSFYLLRSYLNIALFRAQHERSVDKAVDVFFASSAFAEEARKAVGAGSGDAERNRMGVWAVADADAEANTGAEVRSGCGGAGGEDVGEGLGLVAARVHELAESSALLRKRASALLAVASCLQTRMSDLSSPGKQQRGASPIDEGTEDAVCIPFLRRAGPTEEGDRDSALRGQGASEEASYGVTMRVAVDPASGSRVLVPHICLDDFASS